MNFSWFFAIFGAIHLLSATYLWFRFVRRPKLGRSAAITCAIGIVLSVISVFSIHGIYRASGDNLRSAVVSGYVWFAYIWMGFLATLLILAILSDLLLVLPLQLARRRRKGALSDNINESRRNVLRLSSEAALLGVSGLGATVGLAQARWGLKVIEVEVPIKNLPPQLEGFKIAQVSDLHVGPTIARPYVEKVVEAVNGLSPYLIALTGDFVDGSVSQLTGDVAPLSGLRAKHGAFFCTGNHEFYSDVESWMTEFTRLGIRVLVNEHVRIEEGSASLLLAGIHDYACARFGTEYSSDPQQALQGARQADVKIVLAHQPKSCFAASNAGFDLQLSGHTHAGQFFPFSLFVGLVQPYVEGLNRHEGKMWVYVNRGTGYWGPPNRLASPPEITLLKLIKSP